MTVTMMMMIPKIVITCYNSKKYGHMKIKNNIINKLCTTSGRSQYLQ